MTELPERLVTALAAGDCVLWAGAGFGSLAGRPGWEQLCARLIEGCDASAKGELKELLEQGRLATILAYVHRHHGDGPLHNLLEEVGASSASELADGSELIGKLPWRACLATTYADVIWRAFRQAGREASVISHTDVHDLSLRDRGDPFILRTPPTGRSMRADRVFYELIEEAVHSRTLVFLGFDIDDPDLKQILALLDRIGRGRRHYAVLPFVSNAEKEELLEQFDIEVLSFDAAKKIPDVLAELESARVAKGAQASDAEGHLTLLDLARLLSAVDVRADDAVDAALTIDVPVVREHIAALPSPAMLDTRSLLRVGAVLLAHGAIDGARRAFQQVISRGAGREFEAIARFNLALVAASRGESADAVEGLIAAAEGHRTLALVPPRFAIEDVHGRDSTRLTLLCRDRETNEKLELVISTLGRAATRSERRRFNDEVHRLAEVDHPSVRGVRGGFDDRRNFGILAEPHPGFILADTLAEADGPMALAKAFEILGPLMDGLATAHGHGVLHRNVNPQQIVLGPTGAVLRGFGLGPIVSARRPSVRHANAGYMAPEVERGRPATEASDVYSLTAVLYHCVTGAAPQGLAIQATQLNSELDPRVDEIIAAGMHPDPDARPSPRELRTRVATVLTTPRPEPKAEPAAAPAAVAAPAAEPTPPSEPKPAPEAAAPAASAETLEAPASVRIVAPEDPDDLEAWTWILERKPNHMEAREAVQRIESQSRDEGRWDRVAEVLNVRAQLSQAQDERVGLLRELAEVFEANLGAPGNALETLLAVADELSIAARVQLVEDLVRLAEVTGRWAEVADSLWSFAGRVPDDERRIEVHQTLGRIYAEELSSPDRAIGVYQAAAKIDPSRTDTHESLLALYRRLGRPAEQAGTLLELAEISEGSTKNDYLLDAAALLGEELEDAEGALETAEAVRADDPQNERALELIETFARELDRHELLAEVLALRAEEVFDTVEANRMRKEAAALRVDELDDPAGAIGLLRDLLENDRSDGEAAKQLVELLRPRVADEPALRESMIDALSVLGDNTEGVAEKAAVLEEAATLLDAESDGAERAADLREQILEALPADDPRALQAGDKLVPHYRAQESHHSLAELWETRTQAGSLPVERKVEAWRALLELRGGPLDDPAGQREALEALLDLEPGEPGHRQKLLDLYLDAGDDEKAAELIEAQVQRAETDEQRADLMVNAARLKERSGDLEGAEHTLLEAVEIHRASVRAWELLAEVYESTSKPIKAVEAQIEAAQQSTIPSEKAKRLWEAARACIEVLDVPDRGLPLLEQVLDLDPDHRDATGMLLDQLVERGELERAWPTAQIFLTQVRTQASNDAELLLRAHVLGGRCALAAGENEKAHEFLAKARELSPADLDVARLLADLDLDAGNHQAALKGLQAVALGGSDRLEPAALADVYLKMGKARVGMGESAKARQMLERALEIDSEHEPSARALVEYSEKPADVAKSKVRLSNLLDARIIGREDEEAEATRDEVIDLLRDAARIYGEELNRPSDAVDQLERVLEIRPGEISVLHQMLDLYTNAERWYDAAHVLEALADLQDMQAMRAKYLYAGAVIVRDHLGDPEESKRWMKRVLDADPLHEKAFKAEVELLHETSAWKDLSRLLRERLKALPDDADGEERVALMSQLGDLYAERLEDDRTALAAYEQAVALAPESIDPDLQLERRRKVLTLAMDMGEDAVDKAIEQAQAIVNLKPMEFATYHQLVQLYETAQRRDAAYCVARALRFLKQANEHELELAGSAEPTFTQARGTVTRELRIKHLLHPEENARLADLFALIWPVVAAREGQTHAHFGVDRSKRENVSLQSPGAGRFVAYACQVLDVPVPDLFMKPDEVGEFAIGALSDGKMVYPSLVARADAAVKGASEPAMAFRAGRAVARIMPEHILASVMSSSAGLRDAVYGALSITQPGVAVPGESRDRAKAYGDQLKRMLPPARFDTLKALCARLVEGGAADTKTWSAGVEYTAHRVGFLLGDSLELAGRVISQGGVSNLVPSKDLIRDLVTYSVSEGYLKLRKELRMAR